MLPELPAICDDEAEERQTNMPRLYAEFLTAFLTQRQQLEMTFVHAPAALRDGRVPDAAWTQSMQVMAWKACSSDSKPDLHTLVNRASLPSCFSPSRASPIFIGAFKVRAPCRPYIHLCTAGTVGHPVMSSGWARAACYNYETPYHRCIQLPPAMANRSYAFLGCFCPLWLRQWK
ncbi:hypothetical protein F5Y08DRAFT_40117 [Xylaria arbuscula]|nr:hypothetical protein F5Y08DRAFT_40117 [Xylaria arbuscula]